jgi:HPt (histidine-containing phosphotransfer) domain-containing protein
MDNHRIIVRADPEIRDLIPIFIQHRLEDIGRIHDSLRQNDFETIEMLGHSMKGVGKGYGFSQITDIGGQLETAAKEHSVGVIETLVRELAAFLQRVDIVYE